MSKSNYHHGNVEQALLDTALLMLEKDGAEALSLRKISKAVGVAPTAAYHYFTDKDALIVAVKVRAFQCFIEAIECTLEPEQSAEDRIFSIGKAYLNFTLERPSIAHLLWHVQVNPARITEAYIQEGLRSEAAIHRALYDLFIQHGIDSNEDNIILATSFAWAQIHGLSTLVQSGAFESCVNAGNWPNRFDFKDITQINTHIQHTCDLLISGILAFFQSKR